MIAWRAVATAAAYNSGVAGVYGGGMFVAHAIGVVP